MADVIDVFEARARLSKRQAEALDFIEQSIAERGYPPTIREIASHMGIPCVGISGIANKAAGLTVGHTLTHEEVVETMDRVAERFVALLRSAVPALAAATAPR